MMRCNAYNPLVFRTMQGPDWDRWRSLYKLINAAVSMNDRTGYIKTPVNSNVPDALAMPEYDPNFGLSYQDCCHKKVNELVALQDQLGVPIRVMYSGGIDSSLILSSFIDVLGVSETARRIEVLMDQESIHENPWMWDRFIRSNFTVCDSDKHGAYYTKDNILIGGEGNDQLLGTDMYRDIVRRNGDGILNVRWTEANIKSHMIDRGMTNAEADMWFELYIQQMSRTQAPIDTIGDFWWWVNFSCKWTTVFHRMMFYVQNPQDINQEYMNTYYQQFFNTVEFQKWSLRDRDHKHQGNYITYKFHARELVAKTMGAPEYLNKIKRPSLSHVTRFKHACDIIDDSYQFHYNVNPMDWYNPDNSFV